jgi:hypothetical protein
MNTVEKNRAAARTAYAAALESLRRARQAYDEGPAAAYTRAVEGQATLRTKLTEAKAAEAQLEATFRTQFAGADYEMSKSTRDALAKRRDAELVCAELQAAADRSEQELKRLELNGSELGLNYKRAHEAALLAHSNLALLDALADHGEAFARALAGVPSDYATGLHRDSALRSTGEADERAMHLIMSALKEMAKGISDAPGLPTEIGRFNPGPFDNRLRLSPVHIGQLRNQLGVPRRYDQSSDAGSNTSASSLGAVPSAPSPVRQHQQGGRRLM